MLKLLFAAVLCLLPALGFAQEKPRTILVLDASGSMWGQIDGKAKITIAQEVIGELLQSLPADQELGLTVYGHRRKGDCSDIETMILPGGDTRGAIAAAVNAITPKGKTPLSAAVIQAAEALKYTEERATVILISDGRETCNLNTCEVGRSLEEAGIDFTAHVIGFDIADAKDRAELQCLAEETGGTFRTASNAAELNEALQVIAEPVPTPFEVGFRATEGDNGPVILELLVWELFDKGGASLATTSSSAKLMTVNLLPGDYSIEVLRPEDEARAKTDFTVSASNMTVTLVLPVLIPPASLTAPDTAVAGSNITIEWDGPNNKNDYITVAEIGSAGNQYIAFEYTRDGSPVSLKMPLLEGEYQLRYVLGQGREIIARRKIIITPVTATLSPPAPITAGSTFAMEWTGPDYKNDYISLAKPGSAVNQYDTFEYTRDGSPLKLRAPTTPGEYLLRYIAAGPDQRALVTQDVEVVAVSATLESKDSVPAGSKLLVTWTGPNDQNDYIAFNEVGDDLNGELSYAYLKNSTGDSIAIDAPTTPGTYELRYIQNGKPKALLTSKTITVEPVLATLDSINPAPAGSKLLVTWTGPNDQNDYIAISKVGDDLNSQVSYFYLKNSTGDSIAIDVPTTPGTYELRYIQNGKPKRILTANTITVELVSATLESKDTVSAGSEMQVTWTGPNDKNDYLAINEVGDDLNGELSYAYLKNSVGDSISLKIPTTPGTYELRYIQNGKPKALLASKTITVVPVSATLKAKDSIPAGSKLLVTWTGPNDKNDYIALAEVGSPVQDEVAYAYVKNGDGQAVAINMPTTTGTYELRYIQNGKPKVQLAMKPVTVEAVSASIDADSNAPSGGQLLVKWSGPNDKSDYISIAEVGSPVQDEVTYSYLNNSDGQSILVDVPGEPGTYELRYIQNGSPKAILATRPLMVESVNATLSTKDTTAPGSNLVVEWTGPDYKNDRIAISRVGNKSYESYAYTRDGTPLIVKVPDAPGDYEIMYVMGQDGHVLMRQPLSVK